MAEHTDGDEIADLLATTPTGGFLGGKWVEDGDRFTVDDPSTGLPLVDVVDNPPERFLEALDIADRTRESLAATTTHQRAEVLRRTYELIVRDSERLATLCTLEMGKPLAESRAEVAYAADFFRWFAGEALRVDGGYRPNPSGTGRILTLQRPVGPCLLITPWNFPIAMGARKIAPALAAGCPSIVKPSELTPLTMLALAALMEEAGAPAGSLSVLPTLDAAATTGPIIADRRLRKLSFTGSTAVGKQLIAQSAEQVLRVSMELGGSAPFVVFDDADLDAAVEGAMAAKMRNGGEACTSANRFLVHESVAEEFTARLTERMAGLSVGRGLDEGVEVGPLIDERAQVRLRDAVADVAAAGAEVNTGGAPLDRPGWFFAPTVVSGIPASHPFGDDELFGPVAPIRTFTDDEQAIAMANDTPYGLIAYAYTRDLERALRVCDRLESGMVGINRGVISNAAAPFGGVKHSGVGREGGFAGIHEYLETTYVGLP
ncbi:MAG: NAD-dependent succinate-semialdehyde dehydrogenase [Acidimicrobiales bacterium]|nr:NAD-dependent succinate-semialdehyde dehydrogenase [Acidimicrobiales bacterium]